MRAFRTRKRTEARVHVFFFSVGPTTRADSMYSKSLNDKVKDSKELYDSAFHPCGAGGSNQDKNLVNARQALCNTDVQHPFQMTRN